MYTQPKIKRAKYKTDIVLHQRVSKLITLQYSELIFIQSLIQNKNI